MQGLVFDKTIDNWDASKGFRKVELAMPELIESSDAEAVILKVKFTGVCGSDRGIWFRQSFKESLLGSLEKENKTRRILGHECFGEIVSTGSMVQEKYNLRVGDEVSTESHVICGRCFQCRNGESNVCTEEKILGISIDGCFAEYVKLPARVLWPTNSSKIRPEIACMQDPFGNAVHVCTKVDLRGKSVAIFGCGPIGLFTVLIARAFGASSIICVASDNKRAELAKSFGADTVIKIDKSNSYEFDKEAAAKIKECTNGLGADVAFEMAGYNTSVNNAIQSVRRGGDVVLFGIKSGDFVLQNFDRMIMRGITMHSVIGRYIFKTWYITKGLLENSSNGIQDKLWRLMLNEGQGAIIPFSSYVPEQFEQALAAYPKIVIKF